MAHPTLKRIATGAAFACLLSILGLSQADDVTAAGKAAYEATLHDKQPGPSEGASAYRKDIEDNFASYRKKAEEGDKSAQLKMGEAYAKGYGVKVDQKESQKWLTLAFNAYSEAAQKGEADAQLKLGNMYSMGLGVAVDQAKATDLWQKSAEQGNARAQVLIGASCANGSNVALDKVQADKWFRLAEKQGNKGAAFMRHNMESTMSPKQIADGEKLANGWKPQAAPVSN